MATDDFARKNEVDTRALFGDWFDPDAIGLREGARLLGLPYSTFRDFATERVRPTATTEAAVERGLANLPKIRSETPFTVRDEGVTWTFQQIANLRPPPGASDFQIIARNPRSDTGYGHTGYRNLRSQSPADLVGERGIDPRTITRIVWARGR